MKNFNHKAKLSLEDFRRYDNDTDYEFAYGVVDFLSNRPNSHKHKYSEEVIREYAPTVINKWVIAEYNMITKDATTHTNGQQIVGRVPEQEVKYRYDEDGYLIASVDVVISKLYATDIYEIFRSNNERAVSIEELVGFTKETEDLEDGLEEKEIVGFNITGITILGLSYKPSVPNANIKITQMSEESINSMEQEYVKYSQNVKSNVEDNISIKDIMDKLDVIESKLSKKEETMADEEKVVVEEEVVNSSDQQIADEVKAEEVVENACESNKMEENETSDDASDDKADEEQDEKQGEKVDNACEDMVENSCDEEVDTTCDNQVDNSCEEKMAELEQKLEDANSKIEKYEAELAELRIFKEKTEMAEKQAIIDETLNTIKEYVDEAVYSEYENKAKECEYSNINSWKNEALAYITNKALAKMAQLTREEEGVTDIGMPSETKQKTSIYD